MSESRSTTMLSLTLSRYILPYIFSKQELNLLDPVKHHSHYDFLVCLSLTFLLLFYSNVPTIDLDRYTKWRYDCLLCFVRFSLEWCPAGLLFQIISHLFFGLHNPYIFNESGCSWTTLYSEGVCVRFVIEMKTLRTCMENCMVSSALWITFGFL